MILPSLKGELGLQEKLVSGQDTGGYGSGDGLPDRSFIIMAALVCGIDTAKTLASCQLGQALRFVFLPGGAIKHAGHWNAIEGEEGVGHGIFHKGAMRLLQSLGANDAGGIPHPN